MDGPRYDAFLSHNSKDKPTVERIAVKLKQAGLEPWLDIWALTPGGRWQEEIADAVRGDTRACAVFIGPHGIGDWSREELDLAKDRSAKDRTYRLFLVLLPGLPDPFDPSSLPPFLSMHTWVDFRKGFEDAVRFQPLINAIKGIPLGPSRPIEPVEDVCPYRGLQAFDEAHAEYFFGREADVQRLLEHVKGGRFLAVVGASGSGKSSLVRAGLIPALKNGRLPESNTWAYAVMTPGAHPLESLVDCLAELAPGKPRAAVLDELAQDTRSLHLHSRDALRSGSPQARVVLVVDQFEEVFTLCRDEQERVSFLGNVLYAAGVPDGHCVVVLTLRADFYPRCAAYPDLALVLSTNQYLVSPLDDDGLHQAIVEPAWQVGLDFEEGLIPTIMQDVAHQPGNLPLLEHALLELWGRRRGRLMTLEGYRESGGVAGAIAKRADEVYDGFTPEQQGFARRIMLRLTQPGEGTEDTRRRATLDELVATPSARPAVEAVVGAMVAARLLTTSAEADGDTWVDVAHEALIRGWPRLRGWIDEDRAGLRAHRRLTEAAQEWQRLGQDEGALYRGSRLTEALELRDRDPGSINDLERRFLETGAALRENELRLREQTRRARERLQRRIAVALAAGLLIAAALAILAWTQRGEAQAGRRQAIVAQQTAEVRRVDAEAAQQTAEVRRQEAETAQSEADAQRAAALAAQSTAESRRLEAEHAQQTADARRVESEDARGTAEARRQEAETARADAKEQEIAALNAQATAEARRIEAENAQKTAEARRQEADAAQQTAQADRANAEARATEAAEQRGTAVAQATVADVARQTAEASGLEAQRQAATAEANRAEANLQATAADAARRTAEANGLEAQRQAATAEANRADANLQATAADAARQTAVANGQEAQEQAATSEANRAAANLQATAADAARRTAEASEAEAQNQAATAEANRAEANLQATAADAARLTAEANRLDAQNQAATAEANRAEANLQATAASVQKAEAERQAEEAKQARFRQLAAQAVNEPAGDRALLLGVEAYRLNPNTFESRSGLLSTLARTPQLTAFLQGEQGDVLDVAVSPDGALIAGGDGFTVALWDARTHERLTTIADAQDDYVRGVAFSPNGALLAIGRENGVVTIWDMAAGAVADTFGPLRNERITAIAFNPSGTVLAAANHDGTIILWDVAARTILDVLDGSPQGVASVAFSPNERFFVAGLEDGRVAIWDAESRKLLRYLDAGDWIADVQVAFSPFTTGTIFAAGTYPGVVTLWAVQDNANDWTTIGQPLSTSLGSILDLAFSPNGTWLVAGGFDGRIIAWDASTFASTELNAGYGASVFGLTFAPGGDRLLSTLGDTTTSDDGGSSGAIVVWDLKASSRLASSVPGAETFGDIAYTDGGQLLLPGFAGVVAWDPATRSVVPQGMIRAADSTGVVAVSADGKMIAVGRRDGSVDLWHADTWVQSGPSLPSQNEALIALAFSRDGSLLAGISDHTVLLWDLRNRTSLEPLTTTTATHTSLAFGADGLLAVASDQRIGLWDTASRTRVAYLNQDAYGLAISPDGALLAIARFSELVLWDVRASEVIVRFPSPSNSSFEVAAFDPTGTLLASGDLNGDLFLWDVATRRRLGTLNGGFLARPTISSIAFDPDGRTLAAADGNGAVFLYPVDPTAWTDRACDIAGRNLTRAEWATYLGDIPYETVCPSLPEALVGTPVASPPAARVDGDDG
jgi:WD40 repeat protein